MTLDDAREYIKKLEKMEANKEWLPSPFEIEKYVDFMELYIHRTGYHDDVEDIEDKLFEFFQSAYEQ